MIDKFIKELLSWIGTPYGHFLAVKGEAADCGKFIAESLRVIGVLKAVDYPRYSRAWCLFTSGETIVRLIETYVKDNLNTGYLLSAVPVTPETIPELGDILGFRLASSGVMSHLAVYLGNEKIIHSRQGMGVCIQTLHDLPKRFSTVYRIGELW